VGLLRRRHFFSFLGAPKRGAKREARSVFQTVGVPKNEVLRGEFFGRDVIARPLRVNDQIRIRSVRVIDENGEQLGILPTEDALARARTAGLDLIEVSPTAQPPVCKIADYGRLKYEQSKKDKDARKKQRHFELKEVKLRPKIETHDYQTKARMAERLLLDGSKIKVTIMFRGREITYTAFGRRLLDRMAEDMLPLATIEREPRLEGRNMFMILAPRATPTGPPKFTQATPAAQATPATPDTPTTQDTPATPELEESTSA
jgi:translation initiation factor IF-3